MLPSGCPVSKKLQVQLPVGVQEGGNPQAKAEELRQSLQQELLEAEEEAGTAAAEREAAEKALGEVQAEADQLALQQAAFKVPLLDATCPAQFYTPFPMLHALLNATCPGRDQMKTFVYPSFHKFDMSEARERRRGPEGWVLSQKGRGTVLGRRWAGVWGKGRDVGGGQCAVLPRGIGQYAVLQGGSNAALPGGICCVALAGR